MFKKENNYEILVLYLWLDEMIRRCTFNNKQKEVLWYYYLVGYSEKKIAEVLNMDERNIRGIIKSICKKILKQVQLNYKLDYLYWNKVRINKWKTCTKCNKSLPATEEFFRLREDSIDGFRHYCRECEISAKKYAKNT